jgi:hypothetical protein
MLGEDDRLFAGAANAGLLGMVGVVEADGDKIADAGDRHADAGLAAHEGQLVDLDPGEPGQPLGRDHVGRDVVDHAGEITDLAFGVENVPRLGASLPGRP